MTDSGWYVHELGTAGIAIAESIRLWLESWGLNAAAVLAVVALAAGQVLFDRRGRRRVWLRSTFLVPIVALLAYVVVVDVSTWTPPARLQDPPPTGRAGEGDVPTDASNFRYPRVEKTIRASRHAVYVIDADTIVVGDTHVRLDGIAAPEAGHPAYARGRRFLRRLIARAQEVDCGLTGKRTYDREVGYCVASIGGQVVDIQAEIVQAGFARDCRRYSRGRYRRFETTESGRLPLPGYCR